MRYAPAGQPVRPDQRQIIENLIGRIRAERLLCVLADDVVHVSPHRGATLSAPLFFAKTETYGAMLRYSEHTDDPIQRGIALDLGTVVRANHILHTGMPVGDARQYAVLRYRPEDGAPWPVLLDMRRSDTVEQYAAALDDVPLPYMFRQLRERSDGLMRVLAHVDGIDGWVRRDAVVTTRGAVVGVDEVMLWNAASLPGRVDMEVLSAADVESVGRAAYRRYDAMPDGVDPAGRIRARRAPDEAYEPTA
jgi:hypothetical protein